MEVALSLGKLCLVNRKVQPALTNERFKLGALFTAVVFGRCDLWGFWSCWGTASSSTAHLDYGGRDVDLCLGYVDDGSDGWRELTDDGRSGL